MERPYNWKEQEDEYSARKAKYAVEKLAYNAFCDFKISEVPMISYPTTREMIK
jgi:hypothetical protein